MEKTKAFFKIGWQKRNLDVEFINGYTASIVHLIISSVHIIRTAEERDKDDTERHPDYHQRNWQKWKQKTQTILKVEIGSSSYSFIEVEKSISFHIKGLVYCYLSEMMAGDGDWYEWYCIDGSSLCIRSKKNSAIFFPPLADGSTLAM